MADIKKILRKRSWTGKEIGTVVLTNMAVIYSYMLRKEKPIPIVKEDKLQKMIDSINDVNQWNDYRNYTSIYSWLTIQHPTVQTHLQQAQVQYRTLENIAEQAILAEDLYSYAEQLPVIMTEKQYNETKTSEIETYLKDKNGEDRYINMLQLVDKAISFYLHKLKNEPDEYNPLKAIRKIYINEPVKSSLILKNWNRVKNIGYYTLEDGRRSDQMTAEEWKAAITSPKAKEVIDTITDDNGKIDYNKDAAWKRYLDRARLVYNGMTEEEAALSQLKKDREDGLTTSCQFHYKEEPPTDVTKWDVIEQELLLDFYPTSLDGGNPLSDKNFNLSMEDFTKEFSELADVILAEIDKHFSNGKTSLSDMPINEWASCQFSLRQLYDDNIFGLKDEMQNAAFYHNAKSLSNGIAIFMPGMQHHKKFVDERGYFIEPEIKGDISTHSLEALFEEAEGFSNSVSIVESSRKIFLDSYYYIMGYNYTLERMAAIYNIPEMSVYRVDIEALSKRIDNYNDLIPILYRKIKNTDYPDKELQAKKLKVLKDYLLPVDYKSLAIPEENKAKAEAYLKNFSAYARPTEGPYFNLIFIRPVKGEGED